MNSSAGLPEAGRRTLDYTLWLTLIRYNYVKLKMEIKVNGACNCDTSDKTGMESMQLHILKWMVCVYVCGGNSGCRAQKKKKETYKTWILVREERCSKQPGRSWIFSASLGEFAMASHSCCAPFEGFCILCEEIVTISAQNALLCKF